MLKSNKHVFWEALVITVFIFGIGVLFGIFLENARANRISELYLKSEINLLDVKVQTEILNLKSINCEEAIAQNVKFADKIYEDAKTLENYDDASRMDDDFTEYHKRYDLLRTLLWLNSIKIKEKCVNSFHTLVYLYDYKTEDLTQKNQQEVISRFLGEIKSEYGSEVILIPIAKNLGISSIEMIAKDYDVDEGAFIIVDEKIVISDLEDLGSVKEYLK